MVNLVIKSKIIVICATFAFLEWLFFTSVTDCAGIDYLIVLKCGHITSILGDISLAYLWNES